MPLYRVIHGPNTVILELFTDPGCTGVRRELHWGCTGVALQPWYSVQPLCNSQCYWYPCFCIYECC